MIHHRSWPPLLRMLNDIVKELFLFVCITNPSAPMARNENMFAFVNFYCSYFDGLH
jgi:hypothetical protein